MDIPETNLFPLRYCSFALSPSCHYLLGRLTFKTSRYLYKGFWQKTKGKNLNWTAHGTRIKCLSWYILSGCVLSRRKWFGKLSGIFYSRFNFLLKGDCLLSELFVISHWDFANMRIAKINSAKFTIKNPIAAFRPLTKILNLLGSFSNIWKKMESK